MRDLGYEIVPDCLTDRECDSLAAALSGVMRTRAGARHLMRVAEVAALARDSRLKRVSRAWLGTEPIPFRITLFEKSVATNRLIPWHQDTALPVVERVDAAGWGPWSEKAGAIYAHAPAAALERVIALRIHLDASEADNGPLRVVPGSHAIGVLTDDAVRGIVAGRDHVECCVPRGGVIAMRPLVVHASSKCACDRPRRVLHIEYADCLQFTGGVQLAVV